MPQSKYLTIVLPWEDISFVYTTDWHLSEKPIGRRRDDYKSAILGKINFTSDLAKQINAIGLCGADVFHYKKPDHPCNTISLIIETLAALRRFPSSVVYGGVGNHDLWFDRMDSLPTQPLGLLMSTGAYHDLTAQSVLFLNKSQTYGVLVDAFPYEHNGLRTLDRILDPPPRPPLAKYRIGISHQYGWPGARGDFWGSPKIGYNEVADCDYDFLLWGHDHSRKETITVGNTTHINLGSLARAALPTDEDGHPVVATVLRFTEKGAYKPKEVPVPTKPLDVAFVTADKAMESIDKTEGVTEFFQSMDEAVGTVEATNPRDVLIALAGDDKDTLNFALELSGV